MSRLTSKGLKWTPAAAAPLTLSATGPNAWSDWVEFIASTLTAIRIAGLGVDFNGSSILLWQVQFGVGPTAPPTVLGTTGYAYQNVNAGPLIFLLNTPIGNVFAGSRVWLRYRYEGVGAKSNPFHLAYYEDFDAEHSSDGVLTVLPDPSGDVSLVDVTPSATPYAWSAWQELAPAGTYENVAIDSIIADIPNNNEGPFQRFEFEIGSGDNDAGHPDGISGGVLCMGQGTTSLASNHRFAPGLMDLPGLYPLNGASPRLAARMRKNGTSVIPWRVGLRLFGNLALLPQPEVEFDASEPIIGETIGLSHVQYHDGEGNPHVASHVPQVDRDAYYHGFKFPKVISYSLLSRALSDYAGNFVGATAGWEQDDKDRQVRTFLGSVTLRYLKGQQAVIRSIADWARRLELVQRVLLRGIVTSVQVLSNLRASFAMSDPFSYQFGPTSGITLPRRTITREDFPNAPDAVIGRPVPWLYGNLSDLAPDAAGAKVTGVTLTIDAQADASPTGLSATPVARDSGLTAGVSGVGQYYWLSALYSGIESNIAGPVFATTTEANRALRTAWNAVPGAPDSLLLYRSDRPDALQYDVVSLGPAATSFDDDWVALNNRTEADSGGAVSGEGTPWLFATRLNMRLEVYAYLGNDEWSEPGIAYKTIAPGGGQPFLVPGGWNVGYPTFSFSFDAYAGALSYRALLWVSFYSDWSARYHSQFDLTAMTLSVTGVPFNELSGQTVEVPGNDVGILAAPTGVVPAVHVGKEDFGGTTYNVLVIAGAACQGVKPIQQVFVQRASEAGDTVGVERDRFDPVLDSDIGSGRPWRLPGYAGYPHGTTYYDRNGRRYTEIYTTIDPVPQVMVNVRGRETVGDGSGTLISDIWDQWLDLLANQILGDYSSGSSLPIPAYPPEPHPTITSGLSRVNAESFSLAQSLRPQTAAWGLGLEGGTLTEQDLSASVTSVDSGRRVGRFVTVRDVFAYLCRSAGAQCSPADRHSRFMVSVLNESSLLAGLTEHHDEHRDVKEGTFHITEDHSQHWNVVPYAFRPNYLSGKFDGQDELRDEDSITRYGGVPLVAPVLELPCVRSPATAATIARLFLREHRDPPRLVTHRTGMQGTTLELGDGLRITHREGIGASGYVANPCRVMRHGVSPLDFDVEIQSLDVKRLLRTAFILGERGVQATNWASASEDDRYYGYLASRAAGEFADGEPGKLLRPR